MANRARGETEIEVPGVGPVTLCLTMAGMAALEDAFEVENLQQAVMAVGKNPSSRNMAKVIHALMMGTPAAELYDVEAIRRWAITPAAIREALAAMNATNDAEPGNDPEPGNRKGRRAAAKAA